MEFVYDVAGARQAVDDGTIQEWIQAYLKELAWKNRSLAAIVHGQQPIWEGPVEVELYALHQIAGPGPDFKFALDADAWHRDVEAIASTISDPRDLPPLIVRLEEEGLHISDGNHRVAALRKLGYTKAWALVWHDRDPGCKGSRSPFAPESRPEVAVAEGEVLHRAWDFCETHVGRVASGENNLVISAEMDERPIGILVLSKDGHFIRLQSMFVLPQYRNRRLGARMLEALKGLECPTRCRVGPDHYRLLTDAGFVPIEGSEGSTVEFELPS
jgi:GNAT superfamily N-acetyltransferase